MLIWVLTRSTCILAKFWFDDIVDFLFQLQGLNSIFMSQSGLFAEFRVSFLIRIWNIVVLKWTATFLLYYLCQDPVDCFNACHPLGLHVEVKFFRDNLVQGLHVRASIAYKFLHGLIFSSMINLLNWLCLRTTMLVGALRALEDIKIYLLWLC
jgi:hypothetical protein